MNNLCGNCTHMRRTIGSAHIRCATPPTMRLFIGSGGNERYAIAEKMAQAHEAVVRCAWPGSGLFPGGELLGYDGNTVFACANFEAKP